MVPRAGLEPAQSRDHEILSLARIPISPPRPPYVTGGVPRTRPIRTLVETFRAPMRFETHASKNLLLIRDDANPNQTTCL